MRFVWRSGVAARYQRRIAVGKPKKVVLVALSWDYVYGVCHFNAHADQRLTMELSGARSPQHHAMALYQHCLASLANRRCLRVRSSNIRHATLICALLFIRAKLPSGKEVEFLVGKLRFGQEPFGPVNQRTGHLHLTIAPFAKQVRVGQYASGNPLEDQSLSKNLSRGCVRQGRHGLPVHFEVCHECLTSQLSGAWSRRSSRSYFVQTHRFPPMLDEDDSACPLQCKLEVSPDLHISSEHPS
jgi:hypothetical protein